MKISQYIETEAGVVNAILLTRRFDFLRIMLNIFAAIQSIEGFHGLTSLEYRRRQGITQEAIF
jgi:hypothetical protein